MIEVTKTPMPIVNGKGSHYKLCILDFNCDIETGVCSVTKDPNNNTIDLTDACTYCYARYLFSASKGYKGKKVSETIFKNLKEKIPEFSTLRIGKNFECGSMETRPILIDTLKMCVKYKVRPIVTSKILEFDETVADLVKESNGVVHISLGIESMESGAVKRGFTNEKRFESAKTYKNYGCTCAVRVIEDITLPMSDFIRTIRDQQFPILLTPLHYTNINSFKNRRSDISWEEAKSTGLYKYEKGDLRPQVVHPDWDRVKERCGMIKGREYCNNCNLGKIYYSDQATYNKHTYKALLSEHGWN